MGATPRCPATAAPVAVDLASLSASYYDALETHYYATTAIQAFLLVGTGDSLSQYIEIRSGDGERYDVVRTLRMAMLGLLIAGFGTSTWLKWLEGELPGHASSTVVLEKASLDACIWAPLANTLYLILTPLLEGKTPEEVKEMLGERFLPVMRTELQTFFPYNLISFSLIHPLYRPFTTGFVSMCFAVYISYITHNDVPEPQKPTPAPPRKRVVV